MKFKNLFESSNKNVMNILNNMVKDEMLQKKDVKSLYKDIEDEYLDMGDDLDDVTIEDVYEIADASGYSA